MSRLNPYDWLALNKEYIDKYYGRYIYGLKGWTELRAPVVDWHDGEAGRAQDAVQDAEGTIWWVQEELEIMDKNGKIKEQKPSR